MMLRKNLYIMAFLAACLLFGLTGQATASSDVLEISFNEVSPEEDGSSLYLDCTVKNVDEDISEACVLDIFASPTPDSIDGAVFLGWTYIPELEGGQVTSYQIQLNMPSDLNSQEYYPTAMIACYDMIKSYPEVILLNSGSGYEGYAVTDKGDCTGPDYTITSIEIPDSPSSYTYLDNIEMTLVYANNGDDDTDNTFLPIHVFLGSRELGPITSCVKPGDSGSESSQVLYYLVPEYLDTGEYPLTVIIDPYQETGICVRSDDTYETGVTILIE